MKKIVSIFFLIFVIFACRPEKPANEITKGNWSSNHSVDFNQELNEREQIQIRLFLEHNKSLKMKQTNSGLRFMIYKKGDGEMIARSGQTVYTRLRVELLNGTICHETPKEETENFVLEHSDKESGVHEALRFMKKGDRAKLILPSHLAHGLLGNRDQIPPQSILYIDLELVEFK
jgi:FKBP-type peptidyl-prolyl cis-trans isomerase